MLTRALNQHQSCDKAARDLLLLGAERWCGKLLLQKVTPPSACGMHTATRAYRYRVVSNQHAVTAAWNHEEEDRYDPMLPIAMPRGVPASTQVLGRHGSGLGALVHVACPHPTPTTPTPTSSPPPLPTPALPHPHSCTTFFRFPWSVHRWRFDEGLTGDCSRVLIRSDVPRVLAGDHGTTWLLLELTTRMFRPVSRLVRPCLILYCRC